MVTPADPIDELYAVAPAGFIAARDSAAAAVRAAGDKELAAQLKALRRPTPAAWMVNALVRDNPQVIEDFLALGAALAQAQSALQGDELRALSAQRSQLVTSLVARAEALAAAAAVRVDSAATGEAHDTLVAALVDAAAAQAVRAGRLVRPLSFSGFGVEPRSGAVPSPSPARSMVTTADAAARAEASELHARAAAQQAETERARIQLAQAEQAQAAAEAAVGQLGQDLGRVREQLRDLERRAAEATLEMRAARGAVRRAEKDVKTAEAADEGAGG